MGILRGGIVLSPNSTSYNATTLQLQRYNKDVNYAAAISRLSLLRYVAFYAHLTTGQSIVLMNQCRDAQANRRRQHTEHMREAQLLVPPTNAQKTSLLQRIHAPKPKRNSASLHTAHITVDRGHTARIQTVGHGSGGSGSGSGDRAPFVVGLVAQSWCPPWHAFLCYCAEVDEHPRQYFVRCHNTRAHNKSVYCKFTVPNNATSSRFETTSWPPMQNCVAQIQRTSGAQ